MNTATITIREVRPPGPGKKTGSVIDTNGKFWGYFPDSVRPPSEGTVNIEYTDRDYQGKTYSTIKAIYTGTNPGPVQRPAPVYTGPVTGPGPAPTSAGPPPSPRQDNTDERIFVCGIVNNAVRAGKCDPEAASSIIAVVEAARSAWRLTFGA